MNLRIVFDTNVLFSVLGFPKGRLNAIWQIIRENKADLYISEFILKELKKNLVKKIKMTQTETDNVLSILKNHFQIIQPKQHLHVIQENDSDNRILECALDAKAHVLVTGNFRHIKPLGEFQGIQILSPREFLDQYFPDL